MTIINIKSGSSLDSRYQILDTRPRRDNWPFLYSFFAFTLLTLGLALNMFALPGPYKIGIFYAGFLAAMPILLSAWSRQRLTLGWQKAQAGALKLMALL